eukprot:259622_1
MSRKLRKYNKSKINKDKLDDIASQNGWNSVSTKNSKMVSYKKNDNRINVYHTTGTVTTCIDHPSKGKTQLHRRQISDDQLNKIFNNPRKHTNKGYYTQKESDTSSYLERCRNLRTFNRNTNRNRNRNRNRSPSRSRSRSRSRGREQNNNYDGYQNTYGNEYRNGYRNRSNDQCYKCGEYGHWARNCNY